MFHARMLVVVSATTLIALATTAASAQSDAEAPRRGRFLDILKPGQHVRIDHHRAVEGTDGIEVNVVSAAAWTEITEGADEIKKQIATFEAKLAEYHAKYDKFEKKYDAARSAIGRRPRPNPDVYLEMQHAQAVMRELKRELNLNIGDVEKLRQRKLPSSYYEITIVGADYFAVDKGNMLVCYPAGRIRNITIIKKLPENEKAEEHQAEDAKAKPAQKNPSRAEPAKPKE